MIILKKYTLKKFIFTLCLCVMPVLLFAQPGTPCTDPDDPNCTPDTDAPLDTWVFLLVFAILAFTVWHWYKQKKSLRTL